MIQLGRSFEINECLKLSIRALLLVIRSAMTQVNLIESLSSPVITLSIALIRRMQPLMTSGSLLERCSYTSGNSFSEISLTPSASSKNKIFSIGARICAIMLCGREPLVNIILESSIAIPSLVFWSIFLVASSLLRKDLKQILTASLFASVKSGETMIIRMSSMN